MPTQTQPKTRLAEILEDEGRSRAWLARKVSEDLGRPVSRQSISFIANGLHCAEDMKQSIAAALGRELADVFPEAA